MSESLEERLETLERELARANHRCRWLLVAMSLASVLAVTCSANNPLQVIRATSFILVNDQGQECGELAMGTSGPTLALLDEQGNATVQIMAHKDGPALVMYDEKDNSRIVLALTKEGTGLHLSDEKGNVRAGFGLFEEETSLALYDEAGTARAGLSVRKSGPLLTLFDDKGTRVWSAPSASPPTSAKRDVPPDKVRWRSLEAGMSKAQVRALLGEPEKVAWKIYEDWYFANGGKVWFHEGRLEGWTEP
jgi:hypothetical protein